MKLRALSVFLLVSFLLPCASGDDTAIPLGKSWRCAAAIDKGQLAAEFFQAAFDDSSWRVIDVIPGKAPFRERYIFYRKRVSVPAEWEGKPIGLFFQGVDDDAIVYVNGQEVGENHGWDVPFDVDVSKAIRIGEENVIAVLCENTDGPGGIWQPVSIGPMDGAGEDEQGLLAELHDLPWRIVFETNRDGNWELYLMDADGSEPVNVTRTSDLDEMYPHCSPDGTKICFVVDEWRDTSRGKRKFRDVYYMGIDGSGRIRVAENARQPCWSPDGTKIAFSLGESRDYTTRDYATRGIFVYDLATKTTTQVPNRNVEHAYNTAWSPDGKWFAFTVHKAMGFGHAILAMDSEGKRVYPLKAPGCRADWSHDGTKLAWVLNDQTIAVGDFDATRCVKGAPMPVPLGDEYHAVQSKVKSQKTYHPDWSPDSRYIAFSLGSGKEQVGEKGNWDICITRSTGGSWVALTKSQGANKEPDWCVPPKR